MSKIIRAIVTHFIDLDSIEANVVMMSEWCWTE